MFTGIYHLRILLPSNYPLAPPDIMLLTPSGRFETHKKVCIDGITSAHQNSWRPIWGIRTAIVGLSGFWNLESKEATAGMGGLDYPPVEKKRLAKLSPAFKCPTCARSNQEILVEHEETVKAAEAAKTELGKETAKGGDDEEQQGAKGPVLTLPTTESPVSKTELTTSVLVTPNESLEPQQTSSIRRRHPPCPQQATHDLPLPNRDHPLLHPICTNARLPAPIKLYFHLLQLVLLPQPILEQHRLPTSLDYVLVIDTLLYLVFILGSLFTWMYWPAVAPKLQSLWTRLPGARWVAAAWGTGKANKGALEAGRQAKKMLARQRVVGGAAHGGGGGGGAAAATVEPPIERIYRPRPPRRAVPNRVNGQWRLPV